MIPRILSRTTRAAPRVLHASRPTITTRSAVRISFNLQSHVYSSPSRSSPTQSLSFHTSTPRYAEGPTADALVENLQELYVTAKEEFEFAAEETEKKTVYAAEDREAAKEAIGVLKDAYENALKESSPEISEEVQRRVGQRLRELENAMTAVEQSAMED